MLLYLDALPPRTTKGTIIRLIEQVGQMDRQKIGTIELRDRMAVIDVPDDWGARLVRALDGSNLGTRHIRASLAPLASHSSALTSPSLSSLANRQLPELLSHLAGLLDLEAKAEAEFALQRIRRMKPDEAERTGMTVTDLSIRDEDAGLGGRYLLTLGKRDHSQPLPWTRLDAGSPVLISLMDGKREGWRGVLSRCTSNTLQVAFNEPPDFEDERPLLRVDMANDEVARQRQRKALERARGARGERLADLRDVLLANEAPQFDEAKPVVPLDSGLNNPQREAVEFSLSAQDVAIIHGPPGTGKTTTVVEVIRQAIRQGWKVLACAPSNLAVDNMLERLIAFDEPAIRVGHPARVLPGLREHTLDMLVDVHPDVKLARKLMKEANALIARAARYTRAKPAPGEKREMREEARRMMSDARRLEAMAVQNILDRASVVCATTTSIDSDLLGQRRFDLAIVDEAGQSIEPGCWIPLLRCERLILAGDHCQLPPTVLSTEAARGGLSVSMMERLLSQIGPHISRRLTIQYRMHSAIMGFSSAEFYESSLVADGAVQNHLLTDLAGVTQDELTSTPLEFVDTAGASYMEELEPEGDSRRNPQEADVVVRKVLRLMELGVSPEQIAVITPYAAQVRLLRERLKIPGLEVDTVDGFQGREKEAVVISLVRSNPDGEIGFLADTRRMNVALTRARRKLMVIGDSATIGGHPTYRNLLQYFEDRLAYRTVWEEL